MPSAGPSTNTKTPATSSMASNKAVVKILQPSESFPYHPSRLETLFFTIPPEIRFQIYSYVFQPSSNVFNKKLKGWRVAPEHHEVTYDVEGTQLVAVNHRIRSEALPLLYAQTSWRIASWKMLQSFLDSAIIAECAHLHIRKVSLVQWQYILHHWDTQRFNLPEQGCFVADRLSELPSLREVEFSPQMLPKNKKHYGSEEWLNLMETLRGNEGVLRVVAISRNPNFDWNRGGGRNFEYQENVMLRTSVDVHTWDELVEGDWGNYEFDRFVFDRAMRENWRTGPFKHTSVTDNQSGRKFEVKFWAVPENVRRSEEIKKQRREAKEAHERKVQEESRRRGKGSPRLQDLSLSDGEDAPIDPDEENVDVRARRNITREEARLERMVKKNARRVKKDFSGHVVTHLP